MERRGGDTWPRAAQSLLLLRRPPCLVAGACRWLYRLRAEGEENLPEEGGYVLAANHISNLDPVAARDPALAQAVSPVHGEVGAVLVAARAR